VAEELKFTGISREERYAELYSQMSALLAGESDQIANMANFCAAIKEALGFFWVGFYLIKNNELVLGPFQGPIACTRIQKGKGVCGSAWQQNKTFIVEDVEKFPGHIACSSASKSEIVIPFYSKHGEIAGVFDIDSDTLRDFNSADQIHLEKLLTLLSF